MSPSITVDPVFAEAELSSLGPYPAELARHDPVSGRTVSVSFNRGAYLEVVGADVPGGGMIVRCDGDGINALARCLLTGDFTVGTADER